MTECVAVFTPWATAQRCVGVGATCTAAGSLLLHGAATRCTKLAVACGSSTHTCARCSARHTYTPQDWVYACDTHPSCVCPSYATPTRGGGSTHTSARVSNVQRRECHRVGRGVCPNASVRAHAKTPPVLQCPPTPAYRRCPAAAGASADAASAAAARAARMNVITST